MSHPTDRRLSALWMAVPALCVLFIPLAALVMASSPADLSKALSHPVVGPALWLSLRTSLVSLLIIILIGTPLAWWLARSSGPFRGPGTGPAARSRSDFFTTCNP